MEAPSAVCCNLIFKMNDNKWKKTRNRTAGAVQNTFSVSSPHAHNTNTTEHENYTMGRCRAQRHFGFVMTTPANTQTERSSIAKSA